MKQKIVLIVAVAFGLLAAILTRAYLSAKDDEVTRIKDDFYAKHQVIEVLAFGKSVPSGTIIAKKDLALKKVPASGLRGQAITEDSVNEVVGRRLVLPRNKGEVLFWSDIEGGNPHAGGLAADVKKGMRAVSINASGAASVSGMVKPNDHVDVIGTFVFPDPNGKGTSRDSLVTCTILQNVLVLATGRDTAKSQGRETFGGAGSSNGGYSTVTIEVSPREAEMLVFAEQMRGRLTLTLRNRNDPSYEKELPKVDFQKIQSEIEDLNEKRQFGIGRGR